MIAPDLLWMKAVVKLQSCIHVTRNQQKKNGACLGVVRLQDDVGLRRRRMKTERLDGERVATRSERDAEYNLSADILFAGWRGTHICSPRSRVC